MKKRVASPLPQLEVKKLKPNAAQLVPTELAKQPPIFDSKKPPVHLSSNLKKQMDQARIPSFVRESAQLPRVHSSFNDDVKLDASQPADMTYVGKQRKGIHENFVSCTSMQDHVLRALDERFPLAAPIPLPEHIKKAAVFTFV